MLTVLLGAGSRESAKVASFENAADTARRILRHLRGPSQAKKRSMLDVNGEDHQVDNGASHESVMAHVTEPLSIRVSWMDHF